MAAAESHIQISIHAPREGSDGRKPGWWTRCNTFLSTLPARGATALHDGPDALIVISIHAPREGSDSAEAAGKRLPPYFYPRSPRGERRQGGLCPAAGRPDFYPRSPRGERRRKQQSGRKINQFLSTLPARGATLADAALRQSGIISIHAPREGSDVYRHLRHQR